MHRSEVKACPVIACCSEQTGQGPVARIGTKSSVGHVDTAINLLIKCLVAKILVALKTATGYAIKQESRFSSVLLSSKNYQQKNVYLFHRPNDMFNPPKCTKFYYFIKFF